MCTRHTIDSSSPLPSSPPGGLKSDSGISSQRLDLCNASRPIKGKKEANRVGETLLTSQHYQFEAGIAAGFARRPRCFFSLFN